MQALGFYWLRHPLLFIERLLAALAKDDLLILLTDQSVRKAMRFVSPAMADELKKEPPLSAKTHRTGP